MEKYKMCRKDSVIPMESIWKMTAKKQIETKVLDRTEAETVVIGAGMAGILTAYFLHRHGNDVIVLEADEVGSGQTGNTTAKITSQHGLIYNKLLQNQGIEFARLYAKANEEAIRSYKTLIDKEKISCDFEKKPAYLYTKKNFHDLMVEGEIANRLGISTALVMETDLPFEIEGALCFEHQAQFHPLKFLYALAEKLPVYEHTKVLKVEGNIVETEKGNIKAKNVVFAVHYPFVNRPGYYFLRMHQERSYALAVEGAGQLNGMYLGIDEDGLSFRGYEDLLIIGGQGHRTGENPFGGQYERLYGEAKKFFGGVTEKARWSAQDCITLDDIPYVGNFSKSTPDWYVATGFRKWGMTGSMAAAKLLTDKILGRENEYEKLLSPQRKLVSQSRKNFVYDSLYSGVHLSKRIFKSAKEDIGDLQPGHGGIVEYKGKKAGAYKTEDGEIFLVDIKCPHLGCQLEWNAEEKTWDCPCHGSRFDYMGELINNPAQEGIGDKS